MSQLNTLINQLNAMFANVSVVGDSSVGGNLAVTGTTALTGNATAAGTLTVTGLTTLNGGLAGGSSANIALNTNKFTVTASSGNTLIAGTLAVTGVATHTDNIVMATAAKGLVLKQGANGKCGTFVCNGSTPVTVSNSSIAITDTIIVSLNTVGGTVGAVPAVKTITASTGFTIAGTASDTSTYNYAIVSNAA